MRASWKNKSSSAFWNVLKPRSTKFQKVCSKFHYCVLCLSSCIGASFRVFKCLFASFLFSSFLIFPFLFLSVLVCPFLFCSVLLCSICFLLFLPHLFFYLFPSVVWCLLLFFTVRSFSFFSFLFLSYIFCSLCRVYFRSLSFFSFSCLSFFEFQQRRRQGTDIVDVWNLMTLSGPVRSRQNSLPKMTSHAVLHTSFQIWNSNLSPKSSKKIHLYTPDRSILGNKQFWRRATFGPRRFWT